MSPGFKKFLSFVFLMGFLAEIYLVWWIRSESPNGLMKWVEISSPSNYYLDTAELPPYSISDEDKRVLMDAIQGRYQISSVADEFSRISIIREWTRMECPGISMHPHSNDPSDILDSYRAGNGGACGSLATLHCAALIAFGFKARLVQLIRDEGDIERWNYGPPDTHVTVEVYSNDFGKWFVSDPTFNCYFVLSDSDVPLSARELQLTAVDPIVNFIESGWITLSKADVIQAVYGNIRTKPSVEDYYIDPILLFRNVFFLYYDVYGNKPLDPYQKYLSLLKSRVTGPEKIVYIRPPGNRISVIAIKETLFDVMPVLLIINLILFSIPSKRAVYDESNDDEDDNV